MCVIPQLACGSLLLILQFMQSQAAAICWRCSQWRIKRRGSGSARTRRSASPSWTGCWRRYKFTRRYLWSGARHVRGGGSSSSGEQRSGSRASGTCTHRQGAGRVQQQGGKGEQAGAQRSTCGQIAIRCWFVVYRVSGWIPNCCIWICSCWYCYCACASPAGGIGCALRPASSCAICWIC